MANPALAIQEETSSTKSNLEMDLDEVVRSLDLYLSMFNTIRTFLQGLGAGSGGAVGSIRRNKGMPIGNQEMKSLHFPLVGLPSSRPMIGLVLAVSGILIGVVLLLHFWKGISFGRLTRDPLAIMGAPLYTGFLSQIGIFFWFASAAICMFSSRVLSRRLECLEIKNFLFVQVC